jgi:hypothetical protein
VADVTRSFVFGSQRMSRAAARACHRVAWQYPSLAFKISKQKASCLGMLCLANKLGFAQVDRTLSVVRCISEHDAPVSAVLHCECSILLPICNIIALRFPCTYLQNPLQMIVSQQHSEVRSTSWGQVRLNSIRVASRTLPQITQHIVLKAVIGKCRALLGILSNVFPEATEKSITT